jgi:CRISPR-associated exonuclease Cas4
LYTEEDLLPLSALQHLLFCERQCALIHIEQVWADNRLTAEGRILHEKVHEREDESRCELHIVRGLRLRSLELGVAGVADVTEFVRVPEGEGAHLPGLRGSWLPHPVEYKRGRPKPDDCDKVQVCAQALCLEEMLNVPVTAGAIFYGVPRRRLAVEFSDSLRDTTRQAAGRLHEIISSGITPPPTDTSKCRQCSLNEICLPQVVMRPDKALAYIETVMK